MSTQLPWSEIALRLALTALAGALIGINREEHGRSAGLRTTMLVCLAASLSMIQANLLLGMTGKTPASFAVMDLMRLPLGILSGMGFIGAGAILRKGSLISGVTTAATLWFSTTMGLCFGGGQIGLGLTALGLAILILWGLKGLESCWNRELHGTLSLVSENSPLPREEIISQISAAHGKISHWMETTRGERGNFESQTCAVIWKKGEHHAGPPPFVDSLAQTSGIVRVEWKVTGSG